MAKIDLSKFKKKMAEVIEDFEKPSNMKDLGDFCAERIVKRTRLGKGVEEHGANPQSLKALSKSYKDARKGKIAFATSPSGHVYPYKPKNPPKLSNLTSPGRSNLTFTGQMLEAVKTVLSKRGYAKVSVDDSKREDGTTNKKIAGFVSEERPFLNLSAPEITALQRYIRQRIEDLLKRGR